MKTRWNEMKKYYENEKAMNNTQLNAISTTSVGLAMLIMIYAHRDVFRVNQVKYSSHPFAVYQSYLSLIGMKSPYYQFLYEKIEQSDLNHPFIYEINKEELIKEYDDVDVMKMYRYHLPFFGVQEVALLHDVLEDTDFTIEDLKAIFDGKIKEENFFDHYIKTPLLLVTHDKKEGYSSYIDKVMANSTAAMVKFLDLQHNSYLLSLDELDEKNYKRTVNYIGYMYRINNQYHFIENKTEFAK